MEKVEPLGIKRIESVHYYVHDLERSRRFYTQVMDFAEIGGSSEEMTERGHEKSVAFMAGNCVVTCIAPRGEGGRAWRYLQKHPDGIGTLNFEVADVAKAFALLEGRGGTPIDDVARHRDATGEIAFFSIATPFGDTTFRFIERKGYRPLFPGFEAHPEPRGGKNAFGFLGFDHTTSNFQTMSPALLWLEHVMGFEKYWQVQFHTTDVVKDHSHGSGLRSVVMWDPSSGVKFANNEPWRPFFKDSQINIFHEQHRGGGLEFMPTPGTYYEMLPERLRKMGVGAIDEDIEVLRQLEILVDGDREHAYLLQIFLKEAAGLYREPAAGPFFFEIIQRKGDQGFGAGNFRALFESIEREQRGDRLGQPSR
jgi:4-hydroxyphenylpyruvate dioxygenase